MINQINESSLSRLHKKMQSEDVGMISAFRGDKTFSQNKNNNLSLKAKLLSDGFDVTKIFGSYIENYGSENEQEVTEESFFVVNTEKSPSVFDKLPEYGRLYGQDSVFLKPAGEPGYLLGTSNRPDAFPPQGETIEVGKPVMGEEGEFFSKIKNRPFTMKEASVVEQPNTLSGRWGILKYRDMDVE